MKLIAQALTAEAFAPFGTLVTAPPGTERRDFSGGLQNGRAEARASLYTVRIEPTALPLAGRVMERHRFSSQTFLPLDVASYLLVVAPTAADGGPDLARARAFIAPGDHGVTYAPDVWHHPMAVLERDGLFAVMMWRNGDAGDEEFIDLATPFSVELG